MASVICLSQASAGIALPILENTNLAAVNSGPGSPSHLTLDLKVMRASVFTPVLYRAESVLTPIGSGVLLSSPTKGPEVTWGETIPNSDQAPGGALRIQTFDQYYGREGPEWEFSDTSLFFCADCLSARIYPRREFYLAYRFSGADGNHFGWLKFDDKRTRILLEITDGASNPEPDEPIQAGYVPPPRLRHSLRPEGLHLSWAPGFNGWQLESAPEISGEWSVVPAVQGTEILVPVPAANRFFRLRRPQ